MQKLSNFLPLFLVLIIALQSPAAPKKTGQKKQKLTVAITDLKGKGVEQSVAEIITERIRSALLKTGYFRVMERGQMDMILKEQGFQATGACNDQDCLVEMGQIMGVDQMVAGTLGKLGPMFTITLRLSDVTSGEILTTVNDDYEGSVFKGV